jgi:hypothetical protein
LTDRTEAILVEAVKSYLRGARLFENKTNVPKGNIFELRHSRTTILSDNDILQKLIGLQMLGWAEKQALTGGKRYLRLNCLVSDRGLSDYEKAGFKHIRNVLEKRGPASLYEKRL